MTKPGAKMGAMDGVLVRSARRDDVQRIFEIIDECAACGAVLPRTIDNIALAIESFIVGEVDGRVMGCAALVTCGPAMAEVRSVATSGEARGMGVARAVIEYVVIMAHSLEFERLFLLTKIPAFFEKMGFATIDPELLPDSFIADLVHAQKRSLFNKSVMMRNLAPDSIAPASRARKRAPKPSEDVSTVITRVLASPGSPVAAAG